MSKADKLFNKCGYIKTEEETFKSEIEKIEYRKKYYDDVNIFIKIIEIFNPRFYINPYIEVTKINKEILYKESFDLSIQELEAINKKIKELGWLDE
jgi:hypothetical protein